MKLRLINFRCYSDNNFDFGEDGLFLISAPSGQGKSSILMAINFALYGSGQKVVSHGQSSCSVEFMFQELQIIRKKKPNKLVVKIDNIVFDDDVAQNIINQKFGTSFNVTGYIAQNALNSFIVMSPAEKLSFLEKFSFHDINLEEIRTKCKTLIQKRNEDFLKIISQTQTIEQVISELSVPVEVIFPLKTKSKNIELSIKNEETRYKNSETVIKKNSYILSKTQNELNETLILNSFLQNKYENIEGLCMVLENLSLEEKTNDYIGDEYLDILKKRLDIIIEYKDFKNIRFQLEESLKQLDIMKEKEIAEINTKLDSKKKCLWNEYSKSECIDLLKDLKGFLEDAKKISFLKKQIDTKNIDDIENKEKIFDDKKKLYEEKKEILNVLKKKKIIYCCPCCKKHLFFENEKLEVFNNELPELADNNLKEEDLCLEIKDISKDIKILETCINKIKNKIEQNDSILIQIENIENQYDEPLDIESFTEDIEQMENYYKTQCILEKEILILETNLTNEKFSSSYSVSKNKVLQLEKKVKEYEIKLVGIDDDIFNENEEELRNQIFEEQNKKTLIVSLKNKKNNIEKDIEIQKRSNQKKMNDHLNKYNSIKSEIELNNIINTCKEEIETLNIKKEEHKENLEKIKKYVKYIEEKDKYDNWINKLIDLKKKEDETKNKYNAAKILLEKIIESESIAMVNIVDTINLHSQVYLENFFPDNPIVVNLCCFKETKKNSKPQINVEISYKGSDCDITNLSGGETSRVILAFTLALGEIFNVPLLMLDECTASLDSESTSIVFDTIKEHFKNKTVLVVAHQCTEGVFDKIIKL